MKKIIALLLTLSIIITTNSGSLIFANSYDKKVAPNKEVEKILSTYIYSDLEKLHKNISLLAKSSLDAKSNGSAEKIVRLKKDIEFAMGEVNYEITRIKQDYEVNKEDIDIGNWLLAIGIVVTSYRLALSELIYYLDATNVDEEYRSLSSYFKIMDNIKGNTNTLKEFISKQY